MTTTESGQDLYCSCIRVATNLRRFQTVKDNTEIRKIFSGYSKLFAFWVILHAFLPSVDFFFKLTFSKKSFRNTVRESNSLDPNQARRFVEPDLGPDCLQRLSADDKSHY